MTLDDSTKDLTLLGSVYPYRRWPMGHGATAYPELGLGLGLEPRAGDG